MAGKKEAKQKAGPRGQTEKNREETGSSTGTKNTSREDGQSAAQKKQPQAKQEPRPEGPGPKEGRRKGPSRRLGDYQGDRQSAGHLEGRLDKVTAVIRQVAVQGKALELAMPEEDEEGAGCGESSGELEVPALQSNMEGHRIVDIQEPAPGPSRPEEP
jgi:hypothetical protein